MRTLPVLLGLALALAPATGSTAALPACDGAPGDGAAEPASITIRATPGLPASAVRWLARVSVPETGAVAAGSNLRQAAIVRCGHVDEAYWSELTALPGNGGLELDTELAEPRDVAFPACPYWARRVAVTVNEGETLAGIVAREVGRPAGDDLERCPPGLADPMGCGNDAAAIVRARRGGRDVLTAGETIELPLVTRAVTVPLRPACYGDALAAARELSTLVGDDPEARRLSPLILNVPASRDLRIVRPLQRSTVDEPTCAEASARWPGPWPFDGRRLAARLGEIVDRRRAGPAPPRDVTVGVIDTGLAEGVVPPALLRLNPRECRPADHEGCTGRAGADDDGDGYVDNVLGVNAERNGDVRDLEGWELALHGSAVAELALGGRAFAASYPRLPELLRLRAYRAARLVPKGAMTEGDLTELVRAAIRENAAVLNLSVGTSAALAGVTDAMATERAAGKPTLLVVAAGNDGLRLGRAPFYPANYGGDGALRDQVITVAAHDATGGLAPFSNHGAGRVDIAAPGCQLPFDGPAGREELFGTSFAAPLVTFAAGLLRALGLDSAKEIKARLIASAAHEPALEGKVSGGGRLDVLRAVDLFDDLVVPSDHPASPVAGTLAGTRFCRDLVLPKESFLSVRPVLAEGRVLLRLLLRDADWQLEWADCEPATAGVRFRPAGDGEAEVEIAWPRIAALVPRSR